MWRADIGAKINMHFIQTLFDYIKVKTVLSYIKSTIILSNLFLCLVVPNDKKKCVPTFGQSHPLLSFD